MGESSLNNSRTETEADKSIGAEEENLDFFSEQEVEKDEVEEELTDMMSNSLAIKQEKKKKKEPDSPPVDTYRKLDLPFLLYSWRDL